jgi:pimeloyl-ACP methyl ester carboxylesterase
MAGDALVCPACGASPPSTERFCSACGMPLVHADRRDLDGPLSAARERARKIDPRFTEGDLVKVAGASHQAEAELVQGLLLEEGIPSLVRRSRGADVPDLLASGRRDVLVPASGALAAREALLAAGLLPDEAAGPAVQRPARLLLGLLAAVALVAVIAWLGTELLT